MLELLIVMICLVGIGLLSEKLVHIDYDIAGVTIALKQDIKKFIKAILSEPVVRHQFDITLTDDIKTVTKPYAKNGFEIQLANKLFRSVPAVGIRFVPEHQLAEAELQDITSLLCIKFREYMEYFGLTWKIFGTYSVGSDYVNIFICYAERECDLHPFTNVYRQTVRLKTDKSGGILRDEELEAELKHVD